MQNKQNLKNRDLFIAGRGVGVWELKYQTRQSEKMLRGCEVVHLGVIGSNIAGISHVHQKPLPPHGSAAVGMKRAAGLGVPQPPATASALLATMSVPGPSCPDNPPCLIWSLFWQHEST